MPSTLRLLDGAYMRHPDVRRILEYLFSSACVEILGFSNIGKSALMRLLSQPDIWVRELGEAGREFLPVYVDCNRMLEMTDQGFYELILRCLQESSSELAQSPAVQDAYGKVTNPDSEFQIPLSFNRGLSAAVDATQAKIVLLFDEFDEPFEHIPSRVFLNLRAKKDRHQESLVYVTATYRPLATLRPDDHCSEFCELFAHQSWHLAPLIYSDMERYVFQFAAQRHIDLLQVDVDFVYLWAGGHPGLLEGVCRLLTSALHEEAVGQNRRTDREDGLQGRNHWQIHRRVAGQVRRSETLLTECQKIWQRCTRLEQETLIGLLTADGTTIPEGVEQLTRRHLLLENAEGPRFFCRLFAEFVQRQSNPAEIGSNRLWVDESMGSVLVDGEPVETLTNLEYKLMLLFFQNAERIVDKYEIVTSVWGEGYIDEVDDARIEKLISRLRQKVEPVPSTPRFILTVRGRGYRLLLEPAE